LASHDLLWIDLAISVDFAAASSSSEGEQCPFSPTDHSYSGAWLFSSGMLMAVAPAGESHDIFDYLFRGRMMTEYGANPLVDIPDSRGTALYYRYLAWRKNVDTYGPVWEIASAIVSGSVHQMAHWLGWWGEDQPDCPQFPKSCRLLTAYITGYRVLAISLTGLSGWLMASIVKHNRHSWVPLALATWLLNPLTLIATAVGAHNDALMLVLILSTWWSLQRQHPFLAMLALILAAHVKLTALIWLPAVSYGLCGTGLVACAANWFDECSHRSDAVLAVVRALRWLADFATHVAGAFEFLVARRSAFEIS
jgi:hypothetical protein